MRRSTDLPRCLRYKFLRNSFYKPASTKSIIITGFSAIFVLMILVLWLSMDTLQDLNSRMSDLIESTEQKTSAAYQIREVVRQRSTDVRSLLEIRDPQKREKVLTRLRNQTGAYNKGRAILKKKSNTRREQEILKKLDQADRRVNNVYNKVNNIIYSMTETPESLKTALNETRLQELVLMKQLNDLVELEKTITSEAIESNQEEYRKTRLRVFVVGLIVLCLGVLISLVVTRRVSSANTRIAHLASHDDLTGLINRREFEIRLSQTMAMSNRTDISFGLMYLDLDRFKIVNDTCGHHAGDQLLIELTTLLGRRLRKSDVLARIGGDEFAIIAQADKFGEITALAEDLLKVANNYVFTYEEQEFQVSFSIGVIQLKDELPDMETVMTNVDSACYVAKQSGRNRVHVARKDDAEVVKYRNDIAGVQTIRNALVEDRLLLFYQPVYAITEHETVLEHCEILLRIKSESGDVYSPAEFIPLAEKYNIMGEIDRWVLSNVIRWVEEHQERYALPRLLINLSGLSFADKAFQSYAEDQLAGSRVDPKRIAFEITETAAVNNLDLAKGFIDRISSLGCRFALDDFGSGFSTFAYLKSLPIDYLKIDGSLVKNIATDSVDREMVRAIHQIGHTVGAKTIAEFVENDEILEELRAMKVDYAQGYGLQKPRHIDLMMEDVLMIEMAQEFRKAS